jgi:hypothetical protein
VTSSVTPSFTIARISDDDFFRPNHRRPPPRVPTPGEPVWTLVRRGRRVDCELRFHGESYGWEVQFLFGGVLAYGQRFILRADALEEAEVERQRLMGDGWQVPSPPPEGATAG